MPLDRSIRAHAHRPKTSEGTNAKISASAGIPSACLWEERRALPNWRTPEKPPLCFHTLAHCPISLTSLFALCFDTLTNCFSRNSHGMIIIHHCPYIFSRLRSCFTLSSGMLAACVLFVCGTLGCSRTPSLPEPAMQSISGDRMLQHIRVLSSDEFEGRGPGSKGEQLTIQYLQDHFCAEGLEPGNPDGTFLQTVPLEGITAIHDNPGDMRLTLSGGGHTLAPKFQDDFVAWTKRVVDTSSIDAPMIFVGYGVQAPEFQWDDFKGADVKGKVIVVLIND